MTLASLELTKLVTTHVQLTAQTSMNQPVLRYGNRIWLISVIDLWSTTVILIYFLVHSESVSTIIVLYRTYYPPTNSLTWTERFIYILIGYYYVFDAVRRWTQRSLPPPVSQYRGFFNGNISHYETILFVNLFYTFSLVQCVHLITRKLLSHTNFCTYL